MILRKRRNEERGDKENNSWNYNHSVFK